MGRRFDRVKNCRDSEQPGGHYTVCHTFHGPTALERLL